MQKALHGFEHRGLLVPELLRLLDDRRHDHHPERGQRAENEDVENENRRPPGKAFRADRQQPLPLDHADDRAEADGEQPADIEEQQDVAYEVQRPHQDDGQRRHPDRVTNEGSR